MTNAIYTAVAKAQRVYKLIPLEVSQSDDIDTNPNEFRTINQKLLAIMNHERT